MTIAIIMLTVFGMVLFAQVRTANRYRRMEQERSSATQVAEVVQQTHRVEVEIIDEALKEKILNLYEEQEVCNMKISYLKRQNKQYEQEIDNIDNRITENLESMRMALVIQPDADVRLLKDAYNRGNENLYKHKLKYEGLIIANQEKIVAAKKKSNAINEQITKIGREVYNQQRSIR